MYKFAFISRHQPTIEQQEMAATAGIELVHVGDVEAFRGDLNSVGGEKFHGVCCVHPALALRLIDYVPILLFENGNRAPVGQPLQFYPISMMLFGYGDNGTFGESNPNYIRKFLDYNYE